MTETPLTSGSPPSASGDVTDQWSAVINIDGANLNQIEVALQSNAHDVDPHPADPSKQVRRHPVYLVAENYAELDDQGRPTPGKPAELDLNTVRQIMSTRHPEWISGEAPPADGSFVRVAGMHFIAELDSVGNATGRVVLGTPEAAPTGATS